MWSEAGAGQDIGGIASAIPGFDTPLLSLFFIQLLFYPIYPTPPLLWGPLWLP